MVRKSTACNECRMHRRKCIRNSLDDICDRCLRFGRECSFPGEMTNQSNDDQITRLLNEVDDLNLMIRQLEGAMREQRQIEYILTEEFQLSTHLPCSSSESQWNITIKNGRFSIQTGIRNISDLLRSQPIRYLSPRLSTEQSNQDLVVHFNIGQTMRIRMLMMNLMVKCMKPNPNPTSLLLPTAFLFDSKLIMDKLINIYFECFNLLRPLLHQPTFMTYYEQLDSPLDDLLCLCICCYVCCIPCEHLHHCHQELRCMGDYFAGIAKSKFLDQFDLPEKRLENIIAVNFLGEYLYAMLNISEGLKLAVLAFQICLDLKSWYDKECQKPGVPSVECVLFSRHYAAIARYIRLSDAINNATRQLDTVQYIEWKYRPDEGVTAIESVKAQNWHYKLTSHPVLAKIRFYKYYLNKDSVHELKFTDIILVDDIVMEWWYDLPSNFRVTKDWSDSEELKAGIDSSTDVVVLSFLLYFLSYMNDIYATLLTPNDADLILSIIQEQALKRCLHCSQLTVYTVQRLKIIKSISSCHYILQASECLSHTLDVLAILSMSSNSTIRKKAKDMLSECMDCVDELKMLKNHEVDPLKSPLLTGAKENDFSNLNPSVYYNYPQPWYAVMYDICHYLERKHLTTEGPTLLTASPLTLNS